MTFPEVLVAIVLLGTVGVAMLTALRVTVIGTRTERDHSRAYQWLQSSAGVLEATERVPCTFDPVADAPFLSSEEKVRFKYEDVIRTEVVNPPGWADFQITVVPPVKVWDGARYWDPFDPTAPDTDPVDPAACFDSAGRYLQLVTLQVTSPDGEIIESIEVVKRG